jgi:hypothetical protein
MNNSVVVMPPQPPATPDPTPGQVQSGIRTTPASPVINIILPKAIAPPSPIQWTVEQAIPLNDYSISSFNASNVTFNNSGAVVLWNLTPPIQP